MSKSHIAELLVLSICSATLFGATSLLFAHRNDRLPPDLARALGVPPPEPKKSRPSRHGREDNRAPSHRERLEQPVRKGYLRLDDQGMFDLRRAFRAKQTGPSKPDGSPDGSGEGNPESVEFGKRL
jgi:hypothetical protein